MDNNYKGDDMQRLKFFFLAAILFIVLPANSLGAPTLQYQGEVTSPRANAVLRGPVAINGTANHPEFWKYEVRIAPGLNPTIPDAQWTRVIVSETPVNDGQLAVWNTATVPDGVYTLRLRVVRLDGNWQDYDIRPLNVANTVPPTATLPPNTPTPLPTATLPPNTPTPVPTPEPTSIPAPTSTPEPTAPPAPTFTAVVEPSPTSNVVATITPSQDQENDEGENEPGEEGEAQAPSDSPIALATVEQEEVTAEQAEVTATPVIVDLPVVVIPTQSEEVMEEDEEELAVIPAAEPPADSGALTLSESFQEGLNLASLASACLTGATFTASIFLLLGSLYLLRSLVRVFR